MLTTILVGNSNTYVAAGKMITPRGYTNKYDLATTEVKPGQKPLRSLVLDDEGRPV
jgi:precorrin-3B C17-methyltransferase